MGCVISISDYVGSGSAPRQPLSRHAVRVLLRLFQRARCHADYGSGVHEFFIQAEYHLGDGWRWGWGSKSINPIILCPRPRGRSPAARSRQALRTPSPASGGGGTGGGGARRPRCRGRPGAGPPPERRGWGGSWRQKGG
jgi:hypothetical protein